MSESVFSAETYNELVERINKELKRRRDYWMTNILVQLGDTSIVWLDEIILPEEKQSGMPIYKEEFFYPMEVLKNICPNFDMKKIDNDNEVEKTDDWYESAIQALIALEKEDPNSKWATSSPCVDCMGFCSKTCNFWCESNCDQNCGKECIYSCGGYCGQSCYSNCLETCLQECGYNCFGTCEGWCELYCDSLAGQKAGIGIPGNPFGWQ